jgi:uncharacterized membrane protein HdeD (DUF308 family)
MLDTLTQRWWAVTLRGIAALLFGLMALIWPGITLLALVVLFGVYALIDGIVALASAIIGSRRTWGSRWWLAVEGAAGLIAGIVAFAWPAATTLVLLWLIAAWAIVTGMLEIIAAIRLRSEIRGEWLLAVGGSLSVLFGILLAVWPATGALALVMLIGGYAVALGAVLIGLGVHLRNLGHPTSHAADAGRARPAHA